MKKIILTTLLLSASIQSYALNCGNLAIRIANYTQTTCVLKNKNFFYGLLEQGTIPQTIAPGTTSDDFYVRQDNVGVGLQLSYLCGDKRIKFYSYQEYCFASAGEVGGELDAWNDLSMNLNISMGSYWSSLPGQISWQIFG